MHVINIDAILRRHVRTICENRLLTQQQIADAIGLHRTALANWLSDRRSLPLKTASKLITLIGADRIAKELQQWWAESGMKKVGPIDKAIESQTALFELAQKLADTDVEGEQEANEVEVMK